MHDRPPSGADDSWRRNPDLAAFLAFASVPAEGRREAVGAWLDSYVGGHASVVMGAETWVLTAWDDAGNCRSFECEAPSHWFIPGQPNPA